MGYKPWEDESKVRQQDDNEYFVDVTFRVNEGCAWHVVNNVVRTSNLDEDMEIVEVSPPDEVVYK